MTLVGTSEDALNVHVTTGLPYTQTSNPRCERKNFVVEQNLMIPMQQERAKDWVRLLPWAVLTMKSPRVPQLAIPHTN